MKRRRWRWSIPWNADRSLVCSVKRMPCGVIRMLRNASGANYWANCEALRSIFGRWRKLIVVQADPIEMPKSRIVAGNRPAECDERAQENLDPLERPVDVRGRTPQPFAVSVVIRAHRTMASSSLSICLQRASSIEHHREWRFPSD